MNYTDPDARRILAALADRGITLTQIETRRDTDTRNALGVRVTTRPITVESRAYYRAHHNEVNPADHWLVTVHEVEGQADSAEGALRAAGRRLRAIADMLDPIHPEAPRSTP